MDVVLLLRHADTCQKCSIPLACLLFFRRYLYKFLQYTVVYQRFENTHISLGEGSNAQSSELHNLVIIIEDDMHLYTSNGG